MNHYVALLRGINVGGKNKIKMTDLAACFRTQGFTDVRTYIQSGNVVFSADEIDRARLEGVIEMALSEVFHYDASVVLRSRQEMLDIVAQAPAGFGSNIEAYRYDVIYLKAPLTSAVAMQFVSIKEGVDQVSAGTGVLYFSRLISKATQSRLTRIISSPIYQSLTIRNWNTTTKLLNMLEADTA